MGPDTCEQTRSAGSCRRFAQVQVCRVELACLSKPVPVQHRDRAVSQVDQPLTPEVLQGAVHMHGRETQHIPEFRLGQRERITITVGQAHGLEAHVQLTQEMGHPPVSLAPTQIEDPLPEHRRIDQGIAPERIGNARTAAHEVADGLVRGEQRLGCAKRAEAMVHHVDMQALQVGNIAGMWNEKICRFPSWVSLPSLFYAGLEPFPGLYHFRLWRAFISTFSTAIRSSNTLRGSTLMITKRPP